MDLNTVIIILCIASVIALGALGVVIYDLIYSIKKKKRDE